MTTNTVTPSQLETLNLAQEQMAWLQSLFSAMKNDTKGYDTKNLSALGYFLTEMWSDSYAVMREDLERKLT